ncbi:MAG: hydrogenase expression/formation protein HypE [Planctomycetes bacterium]|nr:hydrogenase expression/formation protein HypE [Planctomycetota bacterium]
MGHGSGGRMTHDLVAAVFVGAFADPALLAGDDGAVLDAGPPTPDARWVVSTDAHVVNPLFFAGGDIGRLAVCGTVNDVAMMGATPLWLTAGFLLEEGLPIETLRRVVASMRAAADEAGVRIVAGDTKVVQRGRADGLYVCTTGFGWLARGVNVGGARAAPGDVVLVSGAVGDHGIAVLSARGDLGFEADVRSDVAPVHRLAAAALAAGGHGVHTLRDPTRGGLATTLHEIAVQSNVGIVVSEARIPVRTEVRAACELLGLDPLHVACEGRMVAVVAADAAGSVLQAVRAVPGGEGAVVIGDVRATPARRVLMATPLGSHRILDALAGEILPRIC